MYDFEEIRNTDPEIADAIKAEAWFTIFFRL